MVDAGNRLKKARANALVICTNAMHKLASIVEAETELPLLHIADATATSIHTKGLDKVGLLATRFTMEQDFYRGRLLKNHQIATITPNSSERTSVHNIIYDELFLGAIHDISKAQFLEIIDHLIEQGAQGIVFGCTEIGMLITQDDVAVPVFDTTKLHVEAAVEFALG